MNERVKIVALNSGGLDSVVLMHHLKEKFPDVEVHTLFFDYGQKSLPYEEECSKKVSDKLGYKWYKIKLDTFDWSRSSLTSNTEESYESLYLEMRNMIFLSYATSYAQSIGAVKIYSAIIKPPENPYTDATPDFVKAMNSVLSLCNVELVAPLIMYEKQYIFHLARKYGITLNDFCSCFHTEKTETDKCSNCELIEEYSEYFDPSNALEDTVMRGEFHNVFKKRDSGIITSAKVCLNNTCNLKCPYCLMTGVEHSGTTLTEEQLIECIDKLYSFGIKEFDLFGKEPLFDDRAIHVLEHFRSYEDIKFSMITNGKNLDKYADRLLESNLSQLTISYDGGAYRSFTVDFGLISYLLHNGLPVEISIDLHNKNWFNINKFLRAFYDLGVPTVYIKPIEDWGGCDKSYSISEDLYSSVIDEVTTSENPIPLTVFSIPYKHQKLTKKYSELFKFDIPQYSNRPIRFELDNVCTSGYTSIYLNSNGYVYGCGTCAYERPNSGHKLEDINSYKELKFSVCNFLGRNCANPIDN